MTKQYDESELAYYGNLLSLFRVSFSLIEKINK